MECTHFYGKTGETPKIEGRPPTFSLKCNVCEKYIEVPQSTIGDYKLYSDFDMIPLSDSDLISLNKTFGDKRILLENIRRRGLCLIR